MTKLFNIGILIFFITEAYDLRSHDELICMHFTEERVHSRHSFLMEMWSRNIWGDE